jgi:serine/threonine protein kinase
MSPDPIGLASTVAALGETQLAPPGTDAGPAPALSSVRFTRTGDLGAGGMGVVEGVWDSDLMRELAIKRVRPELRADTRALSMFLWEARVTAYLDHPSIVPVHDLALTAAGDPYFAMKRVVGIPLDQVLDELRSGAADAGARWTLARRLRLMHQVCTAVAFAHGRGVLHRDLKPANVILGEAGEVVVMDWGLAIPLSSEAGERLRSVLPEGLHAVSAGTPLYMSPEQARGEPLDERSDIYSLGVLLYEVASLEQPYAAQSVIEILEQVGRGAARPIREVWPAVPRSLAAVIDCALAPERANRYATTARLTADLERVIDGGSPVAEHAPPLRQLGRWYVGRDRALARLRVLDIDMLAASATAFGVVLGVLLAGRIGRWWWVVLVLGALAGVVPAVSWLRAKRAMRASA